jgi:hypothetical protein
MDSVSEDSVNPRFFDFKKRPYDAVNPRLTYQFWPAFQSELKRKGLSTVMDLRFNPFPTEPTAALRRIKHDDALAKTRLTQYETEYDAYILSGSHAPTLDLLRLAPETERAATIQDLKDVRFFKDVMEKHSTSANTALGIFNAMTTKSVQTDLSHILDDEHLHPRNKVFQLAAFFTAITPPNVAIGEQVKEELSRIPHATTYVEALRVANQIRDFQAELELVNPTATLSLSEMVSKLLSKIRDPKFQMLRFQIAEWEEKRLSSSTPFGSILTSALAASVVSVGSLTSGGGGVRSSSSSSSSSAGASLASAVTTPVVPTLPIIVQFRPVIDLIQKFRLSESTIDSNYSINSVDVIINGGNMGVPQIPPFGAQMPFPQQPGQYVWVPQDSYSKPSGGNGGQGVRQPRVHKFTKGSDPNAQGGGGRFSSSRGGKSDKRGTFTDRGARNSRGDYSSRGDKDSSQKDRSSRGDIKSSASEGGDKKRDRPSSSSSSRAHQAASLTVATGEDEDDDDDEDESSSSDEESK